MRARSNQESASATGPHRFRVWRESDDARHWFADWVEDERVHTFGRSLAEVEELARDALALWLHIDSPSVEVDLDVELADHVRAEISELADLRGELDAVQSAVQKRQRDLAHHLVESEGMTYRDAARLLGISHQRVAQLLKQGA
jgi:predicted RNase H-like HicB family nuclease